MQNIKGDKIKDIIGQTSGFMPRDINALVADASASFVHRSLNDKETVGPSDSDYAEISIAKSVSAPECNNFLKKSSEHLKEEDLSQALERSKKRNASALGTPKVSYSSKISCNSFSMQISELVYKLKFIEVS